jgi:hypothetical protein
LQPISEKDKSLGGNSDAISEIFPLREMKESIESFAWKGRRKGRETSLQFLLGPTRASSGALGAALASSRLLKKGVMDGRK